MSLPIVHFSRRYRFSASHRLHAPGLSDQENQDTYGKCNNPHGHGHNYFVEVTVAGPVDAETGFVVDLPRLDDLMQRQVLDRFDHVHLNEDPAFCGESVPSTENLAIELERVVRQTLPSVARNGMLRLVNVRIEETRKNAFDLPSAASMQTVPQTIPARNHDGGHA